MTAAAIGLGACAGIVGTPAAWAANECGTGTTVTCTSAGNPYSNGISYSNFNAAETVNLQSGVVVAPSSGVTGVSLSGILTGVQTVNSAAGATIETTGDNAAGIRVNSTSDAISIASASVITHGNTTLLNGAAAIQATTSGSGTAGNITINANQGVGLLETFGTTSPGIQVQSSGGTVDITTGTVRTHGAGSTALAATILGGTGSLTVHALGDITVTGTGADSFGGFAGGINVTNNGTGAISITTKSVSTASDNGGAVIAQGNGGAVGIDTTGGTISTTGAGASGVGNTLGSSNGPVTITTADINTVGNSSIGVVGLSKGPNASLTIDTTAGTIHTKGSNATGINAVAGSFPGTANAGTLTIRAGNITTEGNAVGVIASANGGALNLTASGAINTAGDGIQTINVALGGSVTTTINVTGSINSTAASGHGISAQIITGGHNAITVSGSVTAGAGTGILTSGTGDSVTVATGGSVSGATGVQFTNTGTTTLTNSGTITGTGTNAILFSGSSADTFTNSGAVNGNVSMGNGNDTAILNTGSTITGTMNAGNGTDTLRLQGTGSGTIDLSTVTNFEIGQKADSGTWTLTGTGTISTSTTVSGGLLSVNGQLTSPTVTVAAGGTLGGTGIIVGAVTVNGTIAPGNSIGTLNITGPYTQASGSTYTPEVNTTTSDLINVTGTATIQGGTTVSVLVTPGFYTLGHRYTILTASGGVTGQYTTLTDNAPFVDFQLASDANNIFLDVTLSGVPFQQVAQTRNQIAAAGGLQGLGAGNPLFDAAIVLDTPNALRAFDLVSGEIHASITGTLLDESRFIRDTVIGRLRQSMGGAASVFAPRFATLNYAEDGSDADALAYAGDRRGHDPITRALKPGAASAPAGRVFTAWGQTFGNWGGTSSDGNAASLGRTTGGFFTGLDTTLRDAGANAWRFGLAGGYQHTAVSVGDRSSSGGIGSSHVAVYGGSQRDSFGARFGAAYGWNDISTTRSIVFPGFSDATRANYTARTTQVFGEVGYGLTRHGMAIEPFAGLAYVAVHTSSFMEAGGAAALTGFGGNADATFSTIGLRAAMPLFWITTVDLVAKGSIAWRHAFGTVTPTAQVAFASTGTPFVVAGVPIAADAAVIELGLDGRLTPNTTVGVAYTGQLASGSHDHGIRGNFVQRF